MWPTSFEQSEFLFWLLFRHLRRGIRGCESVELRLGSRGLFLLGSFTSSLYSFAASLLGILGSPYDGTILGRFPLSGCSGLLSDVHRQEESVLLLLPQRRNLCFSRFAANVLEFLGLLALSLITTIDSASFIREIICCGRGMAVSFLFSFCWLRPEGGHNRRECINVRILNRS